MADAVPLSFAPATLTIGPHRCTMICDVMFDCPELYIAAASQKDEWASLLATPTSGLVRVPVNVMLIESGERRILVDAGDGFRGDRPAELNGQLLAQLADLGYGPDDIDTVIITHAHADHINGMVTVEGDRIQPVFRRARHIISAVDAQQTLDRPVNPALPPDLAFYYRQTRDALAALRESKLLDEVGLGEVIIPGVRMIHSPGHTAGHAALAIEDGGETLIFLGDAIHFAFEFSRPYLFSDFDFDRVSLVESKKRLIAEALESNAIITSSHFSEPFSRLAEISGRIELVPLETAAL
jgi:glyoxylase-like metal-dependent hydrolase (beta-lactamase superfamily II)